MAEAEACTAGAAYTNFTRLLPLLLLLLLLLVVVAVVVVIVYGLV